VRNRRMSLPTLEAALCFALLLPAGSSQTPPQPGKLTVNSTPPGATVAINGEKMQQLTNFTFAVSPGTYKISVAGGEGNLQKCAGNNSISVQVSSGSQKTLLCAATGWTQ
jgi:hypothetical protein